MDKDCIHLHRHTWFEEFINGYTAKYNSSSCKYYWEHRHLVKDFILSLDVDPRYQAVKEFPFKFNCYLVCRKCKIYNDGVL
jgi:hypothetical protein